MAQKIKNKITKQKLTWSSQHKQKTTIQGIWKRELKKKKRADKVFKFDEGGLPRKKKVGRSCSQHFFYSKKEKLHFVCFPFRFLGHCAFVVDVEFAFDDQNVMSIGGGDCAVFVWKRKSDDEEPQTPRTPKRKGSMADKMELLRFLECCKS